MDPDGVLYAAMARNLSLGIGTLWEPSFSSTLFHSFFEHPPLAIYFQSIFFKVFGQNWWIEKLYSFVMAFCQFSLISWYWLYTKKTSWHSLGLLLFLWICIPFNHKYVHNLIPATLTVFTTFSALFLLLKTQSKSKCFFQYLLAACSVVLAFFSDGPLALFLLMVPLLATIQDKHPSIKIGLKNTCFFSILVCICFFTVFYLEPQALNNTKHFLYEQVFAVLSGHRAGEKHSLGHFFIIGTYFRYYIGVCILSGSLIAIAAKIENTKFSDNLFSKIKNKSFILFISLSIISSWPIAISGKQYAHYAMQSAPFFALAMMQLCFEPYQIILKYFAHRINFIKTTVYASSLLCIISLLIVINSAGGYNKDKNIIQDIYYLQNHVLPQNSILSVSRKIGTLLTPAPDAYFERYAMISLTPNLQEYYLTIKGQSLPKGYKKVDLPLTVFVLAHRE